MSKFICGWYVVYTRTKHEKKISEKFSEDGIHHYLPLTRRLHSWHDRKKYIDMPLFQSYIFVYPKDTGEFYDIQHVSGVLGYVRFGKEIPRVGEDIIQYIQNLVNTGNEIEVSSDYFPPGRKFYIQCGPLTGVPCEVVQRSQKEKILVRIHLLRRNLLVSMPTQNLIAMPA
jgi:transcriptional antiterminator RfaH